MTIAAHTPGVDELPGVLAVLRQWQEDAAPPQLHPGDLGWFWRFGAPATAGAVRTWHRDGRIIALGLLDGPRLFRMTLAPDAHGDAELARRLADDLADPGRGVLGAGPAAVEAPESTLVHAALAERGWHRDEPWTPLRRDLTAPVPDPGLRIEVAGPERVGERTAVQRAAFEVSTFTEARWRAMAAGPAYADGRCLVAYDEGGTAVAAVTVWSAGPGRPGLLEPMGVHRDHRRRGHGRAITLAAAAALRALGASSAFVCTPTANTAAVATYTAAGFRPLPVTRDSRRDG
ncbi:GNAT family N-acetyltransferase [Streptomyces sp. XM4011]|uniref:GNAT family N-acetyltransferase n=1 Tax=Streptomyces sp. XM4011 TaxID=2929780 RepID=UPI001FFB0666|nr:GNAT family N-acetyltransferase [Streptomyces sp. XM4011]MCK1815050.1 GNAT family N-acetyltransferase [Streptomyces sp. XM4011]